VEPTPSFAPVVDAAAHRRLAVFAGAGLSMAPPSSLPDWIGFNRLLLDTAKTSALELPGVSPAAGDAIRGLRLEALAVEAFSEAVVTSLAGASYFLVLDILDAEIPNAHHVAVAALAKRGMCRAVVTTNFDTLIERACSNLGVKVDVFAAPDDFRRQIDPPFALYKIHGSVTSTSTLVDTVSQKLRGLSFPVRARLTSLFSSHHLLVVGFSGADLSFGPDYLQLTSLAGGGGLTWIVEPGRAIRPEAADIVRAVGGTVLEMTLDDVFAQLGVASERGVLGSDADPSNREQADAKARARVRRWFDDLNAGNALASALSSALFCVSLMNGLGRRGDADALRAAIADELDRAQARGSVPLTALLAYNTLALAANDAGDYIAGERWSRRALGLWAAAQDKARTLTEPISPAGMRQLNRQFIVMCLAMSRALGGQAKFDEAREALEKGKRAALEVGDANLISSAVIQETTLQAPVNADVADIDARLERIRQTWSLASKSGAAVEIAQAADIEAHLLMTIGEYDAALAAVVRAERGGRWSGFGLTQLLTSVLPADIAARRGRDDEAMELFERAIAAATSDPVLCARLIIGFVSTASARPALRLRLREQLDRVITFMDSGRLVADGTNPLFPSRNKLIAWQSELQDATASFQPEYVDLRHGVAARELELRRHLLAAEFQGDSHAAARILVTLANGRYDPAKPRRMADLAGAARIVAERAGDDESRVKALYLSGVASDLSGDLDGAITSMRLLLDANPPAEEALQMSASSTLGIALGRMRRSADAEPLLRASAAYHAKTHNIPDQVRSIVALADVLASSAPERARALLEETRDLVDATGDPIAIGKRDAMLASIRRALGRPRGAGWPALFARPQASAALERIEQLRPLCESASEQCDLAELALQSGHAGPAVTLLLDAQRAFRFDNDVAGIARCFHLLADAAQIDGRWDSAADHTRLALQIHVEMKDMPAQTRSVATLAFQFAVVERADLALTGATQALEHDQPGPVSRFTVVALYALAEAHRLSGHRWRARRQAKIARMSLDAAPDMAPGSPLRVWLEEQFTSG